MCDKAVDGSLVALKLILISTVTSKMIKELYVDEGVLYFNEDSANVVFFVMK